MLSARGLSQSEWNTLFSDRNHAGPSLSHCPEHGEYPHENRFPHL
jgi:hypothetical protein